MNQELFSGQGFDLLRIELFRFMNYRTPASFKFEEPYIVLSGATGSGKTTILDALTFALYGRSSRLELPMVKIEDVCDKNGKVTCEFMASDTYIKVIRGRDIKGKSYVNLFINENRYPGKIPEINEKIRSSILGMNYKAFVNSTIIRQDEMKALGSKSSTERLKILQNLFRLDIFEKASIEVQNQLSLINNSKIKVETEIQGMETNYSKLKDLTSEKSILEPKLIALKKEFEKIDEIIQYLNEEEVLSRKKNEQYEILKKQNEDADKRLKSLNSQLNTTELELKNYQTLQEDIQNLDNKVKRIRDLEKNIQTLESQKREYSLLKDNLTAMINSKKQQETIFVVDLKEKRKKLDKQLKKIQIAETNTIDHNTAFKILNQEGRLLERVQRISKEQTWNLGEKLIQELKIEQNKAREDLKDIQNEKTKISKDSFVLSEIKQSTIDLKNEIEQKENRLESLKENSSKEVEELEYKITQINYNSEKEDFLTKLREEESSLNKSLIEYEKLVESSKKITDPSGKLLLIKNQINEILEEIKEYNEKLKDYNSFKKEFEDLLNRIKSEKQNKDNLTQEITKLEENIKYLSREIKTLSLLEPEIEKKKEEFKEVIKEFEILEKLKNEVFHTKGAPFFAINKILPRLGKRTSLILAELTEGRYTSVQLQKVEKGNNTGFEILIKVPEGYRDVATFSGGERTQINAALRLAISEEISEINQYKRTNTQFKKTLFIDEGDLGSLDTIQAQQAFVRKIFRLTDRFKIILITHLTEVANQFPYSINIALDRYGRSIKE